MIMTQQILKQISQAESFHQGIMDICFNDWKKDEWGYEKLLEEIEKRHGLIFRFAVQVGKYNQQVENGGHQQYFENGYASNGGGVFRKHSTTLDLHLKLIDMMEAIKMIEFPIGNKILKIMKAFNVEIDEREYIEDYDADPETGKEFSVEIINENYRMISNTDHLRGLDIEYYQINEKWLAHLELFFAETIKEASYE